MLGSLAELFGRPAGNPAAAAAIAVLTPRQGLTPDVLAAALRAVAPHLSPTDEASWIGVLAAPLARSAITTPRCLAAFLGQCAEESGGFRVLEEDLSYSAGRLCQVWPAHFPNEAAAAACALQPEKLANTVYSGRMGNGNAASGDGWTFRGRGLIQMTGRSNYEQFARAMNMSLGQAVEHAGTKLGAADGAAWFWSAHDLNVPAQAWLLEQITRTINGGIGGAAERTSLCQAALHAIGAA